MLMTWLMNCNNKQSSQDNLKPTDDTFSQTTNSFATGQLPYYLQWMSHSVCNLIEASLVFFDLLPLYLSYYQLPTTIYYDLDRCLQWLVRSSCRQFGRSSSCNSGLMTVIIRGHRVWNTQALIWGIHGHKKKAAITTFVNNLRGDHLRYLDHAGCRFKPCWNVFAVV